ncbi:MAG TPA: integrase family protein [Longimicrobiales bacterium]|nr:integrase family protein [Longimicrobiales bacterium]
MPVVTAHPQSIEALPLPRPPRRQEEHSVREERGLSIIVHRGGAKSWHYRYTFKGTRRKMALGTFPDVGLKEARKAAERARLKIEEGVDPMGERPEEAGGTFGELASVYLEAAGKGQNKLAASTLEERKRILLAPELKHIRRMHPAEVRDVDVARALDPFEARDSMVMLNRVQLALSAVFRWGITRRRYGLESNPVKGMERRYKEAPKERNLSPKELRSLWRDLEHRAPPIRAILRLIVLTGARPGEVRRMRWEHIAGSVWTMPEGYRKKTAADRGKPSRPHRVHLAEAALAELERLRFRERGGFVFPADTEGTPEPVERQTVARSAARICSALKMKPWTPHDLRRTARTFWSDALKADAIVAEKALGHALPTILRTYDRGEQWEERVELLDRWGAHVVALAEGEEVAA